MSEENKKSSLPKSLLVTVAATLLIGFGITRGCQKPDPNEIPAIPTIRTNDEYNRYLDQAEKLSTVPLEKSANGVELTPQDTLSLRKSEPLIKGLIAYDYKRFTHYLLLAKVYFALELYPDALWACNQLFERAPPQGTQEVISAVAETRYVASRSYFFQKMYLEAAAEGKEAVRRRPESAEYRWAEASARVELKQFEAAKVLLDLALVLDPNHEKSQKLLNFLKQAPKGK
jgi:tetratricopeptide (TPR) repeat protein